MKAYLIFHGITGSNTKRSSLHVNLERKEINVDSSLAQSTYLSNKPRLSVTMAGYKVLLSVKF